MGGVVLGLAVGVAVLVGGILERLEEAEGWAVYGLIAAALLAGGLGVPVPEEAVLAVAGWLASLGRVSVVGAWLSAWVAIVGWDVVLHGVGRALGPRLASSRFGRRVGPQRIAAAREFFERHGVLAVAAARFVMGTRNVTFLVAGAAGMPRGRFLAVVAPLGLVSTGIPFAMGYFLGRELPRVLEGLRLAQWTLLAVAVVVVTLLVLRHRRRRASPGA
jgi:membrane protein DedA with SNARE-associated domain